MAVTQLTPGAAQVLMRRNSVYVFVILAGALAGERVGSGQPTAVLHSQR